MYNHVEGAHQDISKLAKGVSEMIITRPNMRDLAMFNTVGRGGVLVDDQEEADMTIGVSDCDLNVSQVEKVLNELL